MQRPLEDLNCIAVIVTSVVFTAALFPVSQAGSRFIFRCYAVGYCLRTMNTFYHDLNTTWEDDSGSPHVPWLDLTRSNVTMAQTDEVLIVHATSIALVGIFTVVMTWNVNAHGCLEEWGIARLAATSHGLLDLLLNPMPFVCEVKGDCGCRRTFASHYFGHSWMQNFASAPVACTMLVSALMTTPANRLRLSKFCFTPAQGDGSAC
mmetsp:Transcript_43937/g.87835  ORF Transcript_43937/g.87835 Transcript_43937/m.87835 type:complete len:206 (+) Transcript_43937:2529-3146(+)